MVRTAVLGAGAAGEHHARAFAAHADRCVLTAVHDPDPEAAAALAAAASAPAVADVDALLAEVDAVVIAGDVQQRAGLARRAIHRGVDVLVEPPAETAAEGLHRVLSAVVRAPRRQVAQLAVPDHHHPTLSALRRLLGQARIVSVRSERVRSGTGRKGDLLDELLVGDLHLLLALTRTSDVKATQAAGRRLRRGVGPIEHAEVLLLCEDDIVASLVASHAGPADRRRVVVTTGDMLVEADLLTGAIEVHRAGATDRATIEPADPWVLQAGAFLQAVERRSPPSVGLGTALAAQTVALSVRKRIALAAGEPVHAHVAA